MQMQKVQGENTLSRRLNAIWVKLGMVGQFHTGSFYALYLYI